MKIKIFFLLCLCLSGILAHASLPKNLTKNTERVNTNFLIYHGRYNVRSYDNLDFGNLRLYIEEKFYPLDKIHLSYKSGRVSTMDDGYVSYACETSVVAKKIAKLRITALNLSTHEESHIEYELDASHVVWNDLTDSTSPCVPHSLNIDELPMRLTSSSLSASNALSLPVTPRQGYNETRLSLDDLQLPFEVFWQLDSNFQLKKALIKAKTKKTVGFHLVSVSTFQLYPKFLSEAFPYINLYTSSANERVIHIVDSSLIF